MNSCEYLLSISNDNLWIHTHNPLAINFLGVSHQLMPWHVLLWNIHVYRWTRCTVTLIRLVHKRQSVLIFGNCTNLEIPRGSTQNSGLKSLSQKGIVMRHFSVSKCFCFIIPMKSTWLKHPGLWLPVKGTRSTVYCVHVHYLYKGPYTHIPVGLLI